MPNGSRTVSGDRARVLIADDHPLARVGLRRLLERSGNEVVAEAGDGESAVRLALATRPHVALLDLVMPGMGGLEAVRQIARGCPDTHVVLLSGYVDPEHRAAAARAGAEAFISKVATFDEILATLDAVRDGRTHTARPDAATTLDAFADAEDKDVDGLTARERQVLRLVAEGHSSGGIAATLEISMRTVETHRQHVMTKLGIHSVAGLTRFAIEHGLV